jgi:hypothetical protein
MMLAIACQSGQKGSPVLIENVDESASQSGLQSLQQIIYLYPSPAEMLSVFDIEELSYDGSLLNPLESAEQYLGSKLKEYALGVYITDLAYTALFGRHVETLDYLDVVKSISEEVNINEAIDEDMIERARNNVNFLDSLYEVSNEAFINILQFCERNQRSNTLVMLTAGAFTESLYLAINMVDDYKEANQLIQHLADQKYAIDNFMLFANSVKSEDPAVVSVLNDMSKIKEIFDGIEPGSGGVSIKPVADPDEDQPKKLVISGSGSDSQARLSEEEFITLKQAVTEIRNNAVIVK